MKHFNLDRDGPLAFPITPMHRDGSLDLAAFKQHLDWILEHEPPALFVACGTGEFASLTPSEVGELTAVAVSRAGSNVPVYVGAGQSLGVATEFAQAAESAGASGLLVFPPYQREAEPAGLVAYFEAIAQRTELPIILYQRDGVALDPESIAPLLALRNIAGLKDGLGDIERIQRIVRTVGDRLTYFNGMPTAETFQPSYAAAGVPFYSSAVFNFVPEISWAFWHASQRGDSAMVNSLLTRFFVPLAELRRRQKGYAVSLVKAGAALRRGGTVTVRAPLVGVGAEDSMRLVELIKVGLEVVSA